MLRAYLSGKSFPVGDFIQELDKRELLFFYYLSSHKEQDDIMEHIGSPDDVDHFYKTVQKIVGSKIRKLPKEKMVEDLKERLEKNISETMVYSSVYDYNYDRDYIMFSSQLFAIERFATMLFMKKIKQIMNSEEERINVDFEELEQWYLFEHKPILNTLGLTILLAKLDIIQKDIIEIPFVYEMRDNLMLLFSEQFLNIERQKRLNSEETLRKKELLMERNLKEIAKKDDLFKKSKEQCQELSKQLKNIEKENKKTIHATKKKTEEEIEQKFKEEITRLENIVASLEKEKEDTQEQINKKWEDNFSETKQELVIMRRKEKEYMQQMGQYKRKVSAIESKTLETTLKEYLKDHKLSKEVIELLHEQLTTQEVLVTEESTEEQTDAFQKTEQKIGYCQIESNKHYVIFADGEKKEILNIPVTTYIGNNQFVKVDINGEFKYIFGYRYVQSERDYQIVDFASIIYKGNEPYMIKAIWDERKIENLASHIHLRDSQVISINGRGELIRFYGSVRHNADNYMESLKAKGQEAYYVMKSFPNGVMVRSVDTGEESFEEIDFNGFEIQEQEVLCVKDNQIVYVYRSHRFYTHSSYYKKAQTGVAELQDDKVFVRKMSGEIVIVNDIPYRMTIAEGEILIVDENANFITIKRERIAETSVERKRIGMTKNTPKKRSERIKIEREVLIIGKITYENSYKMAFFKNGYRAQVIDGYEPWSRIRSSLKDKDAVVVVSEFISHDNMWRLKDEGLDIPLLFPEHDGANRILEEVEATFEANTI